MAHPGRELAERLIKVLQDEELEHYLTMGSKHPVFVIKHNGEERKFTFPGSPSDYRAADNSVAQLKRLIRRMKGEDEEMMIEVAEAAEECPDGAIDVLGHYVNRIEYDGMPVVTLFQIDELHERPQGTAGRQFRQHRDRFVHGRDYFEVNADEFRRSFPEAIGSRGGGSVYLITERGYGKIVKGWNDDRSWDLLDAMQDAYFMVKGVPELVAPPGLPLLEAPQPLLGLEEINAKLDLAMELFARLEARGTVQEPVQYLPKPETRVDLVTTREIIEMAGVGSADRCHGTDTMVRHAMKMFCGIEDRTSDGKPLFLASKAVEWLKTGGKYLIRIQMNEQAMKAREKRGLRLVASR